MQAKLDGSLSVFVDAVDWAHEADLLNTTERKYLLAPAQRDPTDAGAALAKLHAQREVLHAFLLAGIENTNHCAVHMVHGVV